jgi:hypothetical protein
MDLIFLSSDVAIHFIVSFDLFIAVAYLFAFYAIKNKRNAKVNISTMLAFYDSKQDVFNILHLVSSTLFGSNMH